MGTILTDRHLMKLRTFAPRVSVKQGDRRRSKLQLEVKHFQFRGRNSQMRLRRDPRWKQLCYLIYSQWQSLPY